jgi:hypothetical protein
LFHNYSLANAMLALIQCEMRGIQPGPINTFPGWKALGRHVIKGQKAISLVMPITYKKRDEENQQAADAADRHDSLKTLQVAHCVPSRCHSLSMPAYSWL